MTTRAFAIMASIAAGDTLIADGGFTCVKGGEIVTVRRDRRGELYFPCAGPDEGENCGADHGKPATDKRKERHYLDGQSSFDSVDGAMNIHNGEAERCVGLYDTKEMG
jgi:hypothetical protein